METLWQPKAAFILTTKFHQDFHEGHREIKDGLQKVNILLVTQYHALRVVAVSLYDQSFKFIDQFLFLLENFRFAKQYKSIFQFFEMIFRFIHYY